MDNKVRAIIIFCWSYALFEIVMGIIQNKKANILKSGDKGSALFMYIMMAIGLIISFKIAATPTGRINYDWNTFFIIGGIISLTGLIIRITSIITLKQYFTYTVTKIENHKLIESGLYKYIRHPGYLGGLIIMIGVAVSLLNWIAILAMLLSMMTGYIYRIKVEERLLEEHLGEKYKDYQKRTKKLIPKIY